jgi:hypothetical protein
MRADEYRRALVVHHTMLWLPIVLALGAHPALAGTHDATPLVVQRTTKTASARVLDLGDLPDPSDSALPAAFAPTVVHTITPIVPARVHRVRSAVPLRHRVHPPLLRTSAADDEPPQTSS